MKSVSKLNKIINEPKGRVSFTFCLIKHNEKFLLSYLKEPLDYLQNLVTKFSFLI